jgi:PAS domain S-box-containing protein
MHIHPQKNDSAYQITDSIPPNNASLAATFGVDDYGLTVDEALTLPREQLYRLVNNIRAIPWVYDVTNDKWTHIGPRVTDILGYPPEEWSGLQFWKEHVHEDDRQWAYEYCLDCCRQGQDHTFNYRFLKADGGIAWIEDIVNIEMRDGKPFILRGMMIDRTEAMISAEACRTHETNFRSLFKGMKDGFAVLEFIIDQSESPIDARFISVNPAFERLMGLFAADIIGSTSLEILPEIQDCWSSSFRNSWLTRESSNFEFHSKRAGKDFWVNLFPIEAHKFGLVIHDITQRNFLEKALLKSKQTLQIVADFTYDWEYWLDSSGRLNYISPSCERITGYSKKDFLADPSLLLAITHPEDQTIMAEHGNLVCGNKDHFDFDYRIVTRDNRIKWLNHICRPVIDEQGEYLGRRVSVRDITERKILEESHREHEEYLQSSVNLLTQPNLDIQGLLDYALEETVRITGSKLGYIYFYNQERQEFVLHAWSKAVINECAIQHPQTVYRLDKTGIWGEAVRQNRPIIINDFNADNPMKKGYPPGHAPLTRFMTLPVHDGDNIVAVVGVANKDIDYSETDVLHLSLYMQTVWKCVEQSQSLHLLQEQEARLKDVAEHSRTFVWEVDAAGLYTYSNSVALDIFGYHPDEITNRLHFFDLHPDEGRDRFKASAFKAFSAKLPIIDLINPIVTKNGDIKWVSTNAFPILNTDGSLKGYRGSDLDITERKKGEEKQRKLQEKAEMSSHLAAVGEMAAGIAHEINNPLTSIIGFADLLTQNRSLPEDVRECLTVINHSSLRVKDIVKRMLTFARQIEPTQTAVDITELIDHTLELRSYALKTSNIKVIRDYTADLPMITIDPGQIQQVLLNLVVNAEFAMRSAHDKGVLTIRAEKTASHVRITVSDDGPGVPEDILNKVFNPFFTTKELGEGTGLGLSLSIGIVHEHKGDLRCESIPGQGASFILELPVTEAKPAPAFQPVEPKESKSTVTNTRVLIVDDEESIRFMLKRALSDEGFLVEVCEHAEHAVDHIINGNYDVILADIRMPGLNGIELHKHISKTAPKMGRRIIMITGDVYDKSHHEYISEHQIPLVGKPFDLATILRDIQQLMTD